MQIKLLTSPADNINYRKSHVNYIENEIYFSALLISDLFMAKAKISMITPYYPPVKGGISSYVFSLTSNLIHSGFDVKVIANSAMKCFVLSKVCFIVRSYIDLSSFKPEIIHAHSNWYVLLPSALYKSINNDTHLVFTFHTEIGKLKGIKKALFEYLLSKCDDVTFVSRDMMKKITGYYSINARKYVIYAGVSQKVASENEVKEFKERHELINREPVITFIGPLTWEKKVEGVELLIKSFPSVARTYPESVLLIVGDGQYRLQLEALVDKLNLTENVVFTGFLKNVFVPLSISDIYAHISLMDGCPISLLEAMSCKKPIIATNIGGIPEIITDNQNGYLVNPNEAEISEKIVELLHNEIKRNRFAKESVRVLNEKFTWKKIVKQFISIYDRDLE